MPNLKSVYLYPYSGWHDRPWSHGEKGEDGLALDAAARSARRVTESLTRELVPLGLAAPRTRLMAMCGLAAGTEVEVMPFCRADDFLGHLQIPPGFDRVLPSRRADLLTDAFEHLLTSAAEPLNWDPEAVRAAAGRVRESAYECGWQSPWKLTRDRQRQIRLEGYLEDDGYLRCRVVVTGRNDETPLVTSQTWVGWTWIENVVQASKGMRFVDRETLVVPSGSRMDGTVVTVDLTTGHVDRDPATPRLLSYPGDPDFGPQPKLVVQPWVDAD